MELDSDAVIQLIIGLLTATTEEHTCHPDFIRRQPTKDSGPLCPVRNLVLGLRHYRIVINHPGIAALGYHHRPETVESRSVGNGLFQQLPAFRRVSCLATHHHHVATEGQYQLGQVSRALAL